MRRATKRDDELASIVRAQQVPRELFMGTLRLFGDSLLADRGESKRFGPYRLYPGILVSVWASFEAFVRIYSELFVKSAKELPEPAADALLEKTQIVDEQGKLQTKFSPRPLLHRYWWLLKFGYGCDHITIDAADLYGHVIRCWHWLILYVSSVLAPAQWPAVRFRLEMPATRRPVRTCADKTGNERQQPGGGEYVRSKRVTRAESVECTWNTPQSKLRALHVFRCRFLLGRVVQSVSFPWASPR